MTVEEPTWPRQLQTEVQTEMWVELCVRPQDKRPGTASLWDNKGCYPMKAGDTSQVKGH